MLLLGVLKCPSSNNNMVPSINAILPLIIIIPPVLHVYSVVNHRRISILTIASLIKNTIQDIGIKIT